MPSRTDAPFPTDGPSPADRRSSTAGPSKRDRVLGCLLGGSVGDAMGAGIEFHSLEQIREQFGPQGVRDYTPAYGLPCAITDDTQMTLFTAEGCIRASNRSADQGHCDPTRVVRRAYLRWLHTQGESVDALRRLDDMITDPPSGWLIRQRVLHARRAPGNTCLSALRAPGGEFRARNDSKGCGGVMRIAPVGLFVSDPFQHGCDFAAITHGHPTGWLAAGALAVIVGELLQGAGLDAAVDRSEQILRERPDIGESGAETLEALGAARELAAKDAPPGGSPSAESVESLGEGWIAEEALAIAVYCALVSGDFASAVLLAVNHGGDSDSTGAITGNLIGTMQGIEAIPGEWLEPLDARDVIEQVAEDLAAHAGFTRNPQRPVPDYERYPPW